MKILIVDDLEENRYMLEVLLQGYGYEVEKASDGVEALEKAAEDDFDMIISDILMPRMDGFQLCREVKKDERLKKIAFVFYTASYTAPEDEEFALKLGAESFIIKPTYPDDFIEIIEKIIKAHEAGALAAPKPPIKDETIYLKEYNERLIRKLESKMLELESANRSIKESEEKYKNLIDHASDAVIVIGSAGDISFVNPKFCEMTGYSIYEAKKLHFNKLVHPDDMDMAADYFEKRLRGEKVSKDYEVRLLTKSGKTIYTDNNTSIMEKEGRLIGILTIMRDITARKRAEEQVHKLSRAVDQSPSLVMITDIKGNIEYVNPKFTQITGFTLEEVIGKNPRILKSGKMQPEEYKRLWSTIISGGEWRGEFYNRKKNGELYWESASISSIKNSKGVITHFIAVKEDITDRKQAEDEIRMLAHTLESINDCVNIADMDNTIIYVNKAFCDVYGYKEEEIIGKNSSVLPSHLNPEELTKKILQQTLKGGWSGELYNKRKDGSNFPIYLSTSVIKDEKGKSIALVGVSRDITEHKRADEKIKEYSEKLEQMVEERTKKLNMALNDAERARDKINAILKSIADGLIVTDLDNRIVLMNYVVEDLLNIRLGEVLSKTLDSVIKEDTLRERFAIAISKLETGYEFDFELSTQNDKQPRTYNARTSIIKNKKGTAIGIIITFHDVTHEREIDRMKTEFISTAAHELRTPLTTIQGFSEILLQRKELGDKEKNKFLSYINRQSENLAAIINDLLDLSRIESGQSFVLEKEPCLLHKITEKVVDIFKKQNKRHRFKIKFVNEPEYMYFDKDKIFHVFRNLISNSVKYSPEGGLIQIKGDIVRDYYQISVQDEGIGMSPDQVNKIFNKFYRADASDTAVEGTGLGMSIVKYIVEGHGGKVWVESELNRGTIVFFTIPFTKKTM